MLLISSIHAITGFDRGITFFVLADDEQMSMDALERLSLC